MPVNRCGFMRLPAILAMLATVLFLTACGMGAAPPPSPTPRPTPDKILAAASAKLAETQSVHFALVVDGESFIDTGHTIRLLGAEGDLVRPDRVQTTFQAEVMGNAISLQLITIGQESWATNLLTGAWGPAPIEFSYRPDILFSTQDGIGPVMGRVQNITLLDDEKVGDRWAYHLQADVDQDIVGPLTYYTIQGSPVRVDLWIDRETSDLLRARLSEPPGPDRPKAAVWTLDLSHHGGEIAIEPPA